MLNDVVSLIVSSWFDFPVMCDSMNVDVSARLLVEDPGLRAVNEAAATSCDVKVKLYITPVGQFPPHSHVTY